MTTFSVFSPSRGLHSDGDPSGVFARELCRRSGALRDLRLDELHGDSSTPTREEITTVRFADISQAYRELLAGTG
ncbi:hypothetical protein [Streptomyces xiaopingdaonensis]|uniref:hypothetical protein n=1 Tax=Streptomyces xiaopingdaonensis TaxID=1565415 RepID=UPI000317B69B|nr:hypothetical protein [Streptomyces xiaopingdaonensis]